VIGKCPKCGNELIIRTSRSGDQFVGCTNFPRCKNTYSLPKIGDVVTTDKVCNECKTPIIKVKSEGKPLEDICLNPDCSTRKK
jgi:DNA topoisomerase-1